MAGLNEKFLFVDSNGDRSEADAAITTSAGVSDAGKLVQTNASGKLDSSLINFSAFNKVYSARVATTVAITIASPGAVIDGQTLFLGDRILLKNQASAATNGLYVFDTASTPLVRASDWDEASEIKAGDAVIIEEGSANAEQIYLLTTNNPIVVGTTALNFSPLGTQLIAAGDALSFSGTTLHVNPGDGTQILTDTLAVKVSDFAGLGLEDDGSNNLAIDFANPATEMGTSRAVKASDLSQNASDQGAKILGFDPVLVSGYTAATKIQGAIEDAFGLAASPGVSYTVGAGGVTKGHPLYISADDTVRAYGALSNASQVIGVAMATTSAAGSVRALHNSTLATGVLSGATAGQSIYWNGSALTATIPSGGGSHVWRIGWAKNTTDLHVNIEFIKKNA
jgi:hypothetical protein